MGVYYETIPESLRPWILDQKMLWVATAPLSPDGHINISPKGGPYFGIISPTKFWFMDLTGSGVETHAHLHEPGNARICVMFMAFEGAPRIIRLWGRGRPIENGTEEYEEFVKENNVTTIPGSRSIILLDVHQVASSCGFSVPFYDFKGYRTRLNEHFEKKEKAFLEGKEGESMDKYWAYKSQLSVDGLPGMKRGYDYAKKNGIKPLDKFKGPLANGLLNRKSAAKVDISLVQLFLIIFLAAFIGIIGTLTIASPELVKSLQNKEAAVWITGTNRTLGWNQV